MPYVSFPLRPAFDNPAGFSKMCRAVVLHGIGGIAATATTWFAIVLSIVHFHSPVLGKSRTNRLLVLEQTLFDGGPAGGGEAAETAVGAEDAVAGDDQRDRVGRHDAADGAGGRGAAHLPGQIAVSHFAAKGYGSTGRQDLLAEETGVVQVYRRIDAEINRLSFEVGDDLLLHVREVPLAESDVVGGRTEAPEQPAFGRLAVRGGQERPADGVVRAGKGEIAPLRPKNRVVQHSWPPISRFVARYQRGACPVNRFRRTNTILRRESEIH
ncbi:MAG TPA: hypothetical protein VLI39_04325 [Sedimentisphaerales bacterium]|nr:hypothetical protein [Sedimentisphaerales bacterium]